VSVRKKREKMEEARPKEKCGDKGLAKTAGEASSHEKPAPPPKRRKETSEPSGAFLDDSDEFLSEKGPMECSWLRETFVLFCTSVESVDIRAIILSLTQRMGDLE